VAGLLFYFYFTICCPGFTTVLGRVPLEQRSVKVDVNTALPELKVTHVTLTCVIIKMWFADHRWSAAVWQVVRGFPKAISKEKATIASV
jgi:hypothetical protein